jgi:hypothetical protein
MRVMSIVAGLIAKSVHRIFAAVKTAIA